MFGKKKKDEAAEGEEGEEKQDEIELQDKQGDMPAIGSMKRGDYMIHVYIQRGKDFKTPADSTIDPLIEVSCLG